MILTNDEHRENIDGLQSDDHPNSYDDQQYGDDHGDDEDDCGDDEDDCGDGEYDCGYGYEEDSEHSGQQVVLVVLQ